MEEETNQKTELKIDDSPNRAATLIVAAMIFTRMEPSHYVDGDNDQNPGHAIRAFNAAESFVDEAKARGYDPLAIMNMAMVTS